MNKKEMVSRIIDMQNDISFYKSKIDRIEGRTSESEREISKLKCYEETGHDWLYVAKTRELSVQELRRAMVTLTPYGYSCHDKFEFKCRDCGKIDYYDWEDLEPYMKKQVRAIDPDLVPKKK